MQNISIIRASTRASSLDVRQLAAIDGQPYALMCEAPPLLMARIVAEAHNTESQALFSRHQVLARAGRLFAEATLDGQSPEHYCRDAAATSGLPAKVFRAALVHYASALHDMGSIVESQKPRDAVPLDAAAIQGLPSGAIWVPRGRVLAIIAPGNHPEAHVGWLQALAFGYNVVVKPSRRDVFTPMRLVRALIESGLRPGEISFAPGDHRAGQALVEAADLSLVYGGPDAIALYRGDRRVLVRGPGRSKIFVQAREPLSAARIEFLARCVAADGGTRCTNASAILVDGDHEAVALALALALARTPNLPSDDDRAELAVLPLAEANATRTAFDAVRAAALDLCRSFDDAPAVNPLSEQTAVLRPAVVAVSSPDAPGFSSEFPFPCVWVAPWRPEHGIAPLRGSLSLTLLTDDLDLLAAALREPSIRKVFAGEVPTFHSASGLPHDGALADFLFESKAFSSAVGIRHAG
jgi:acyl-CoA reductase-like NAD-dependent aldehyde dehydrogenase